MNIHSQAAVYFKLKEYQKFVMNKKAWQYVLDVHREIYLS
jgi:hypothetical protein